MTTLAPPTPLASISRQLAALAGESEAQVENALLALSRRDLRLAFEVMAGDARLTGLNHKLEADATSLLAGILDPALVRECMVAVKIASMLTHVNGYAAEIAISLQSMGDSLSACPPERLTCLGQLGSLARQILHEAVDACIRRDAKAARDASHHDDEAEELYASLLEDLLAFIALDPANVKTGAQLLFIARSIERISDHARVIADYVTDDLTGAKAG